MHTVPGHADFIVNIRDTDGPTMAALVDAVKDSITDAARSNGLTCMMEEQSPMAPVTLDPGLTDILRQEAARLGLAALDMPSGAGHDAQTMQALCPAALVFVPSRAGVSHSPEEFTAWPDIEQGAALMLATLVRLATGRPVARG